MGWYGHYEVLLGYDESRSRFIGHDSYVGQNQPITYDRLEASWRHFNYPFLVIYPPGREAEVLAILGPYADETAAIRIAAQRASDEIFRLEGRDQFFAWFNRGFGRATERRCRMICATTLPRAIMNAPTNWTNGVP